MKQWAMYSVAFLSLGLFGPSRARAVEGHPPIEYRALKIQDFPIREHVPAKQDAFTSVQMVYHPQQKTIQDGTMWRSEVVMMEIQCLMAPDKSWRRGKLKDAPATLSHEQGHFDICEGKARLLRMQTLGVYPVGRGSDKTAAEADLTHALNMYFSKRFEELKRDHHKYDKETKFGKAEAKQKAWAERLAKSTHE